MKRIILVLCAVSYLIIFGLDKANAAEKNLFYTIPKGTTVLAFIGDPHSLDLIPIRITAYEDQTILVFHRKSGRGIWAFYLRGFVQLHSLLGRHEISDNGYFMISKRKIRKTGWR